ncbi:MAG: hypothetical protein ACR2RA_21870 [Geminicoccaceae bacterium]
MVSARRVVIGAALLLLGACAGGEPREPTKVVDEIPSGQGILSGEDGEFVIYRR